MSGRQSIISKALHANTHHRLDLFASDVLVALDLMDADLEVVDNLFDLSALEVWQEVKNQSAFCVQGA